jgi:hypothetical protein
VFCLILVSHFKQYGINRGEEGEYQTGERSISDDDENPPVFREEFVFKNGAVYKGKHFNSNSNSLLNTHLFIYFFLYVLFCLF